MPEIKKEIKQNVILCSSTSEKTNLLGDRISSVKITVSTKLI